MSNTACMERVIKIDANGVRSFVLADMRGVKTRPVIVPGGWDTTGSDCDEGIAVRVPVTGDPEVDAKAMQEAQRGWW
jgi:hypothetical protein